MVTGIAGSAPVQQGASNPVLVNMSSPGVQEKKAGDNRRVRFFELYNFN